MKSGSRIAAVATLVIAASFFFPTARAAADVSPIGDDIQVNPPGALSSTSAQLQRNRHVSAADDGSFVVTWWGANDGDDPYNFYSGIWARRFDATGTATSDRILVGGNTTASESNPAVASRGDGSFIVVWQRSDDLTINGNEVQARMFDASGSATTDVFRVNAYTTEFQGEPSVDAFDDDTFIVVWTSLIVGQAADIRGQRLDDDGSARGTEFTVNTYTTLAQGEPNVSTHDDGFVATWGSLGIDGSLGGVVARRFDTAGNGLGNDILVNTYTTFTQETPDVSAADDGSFVVVWASRPQDGDDNGVYAQRYDASGAPDGTEFQVSVTTTGEQHQPSVHHDGDGFVVAWTDEPNLPSPADPIETMVRCYDDMGAPATGEIPISEAQSCTTCGTGITRAGTGEYVVTWVGPPDGQFGFAVRAQRLASASPLNVCGDPLDPSFTTGGLVTASDAVFALKAAIGSETCAACVCDVDDSGLVTATDALIILQAAVGLPVVLSCPAC